MYYSHYYFNHVRARMTGDRVVPSTWMLILLKGRVEMERVKCTIVPLLFVSSLLRIKEARSSICTIEIPWQFTLRRLSRKDLWLSPIIWRDLWERLVFSV